jgi:hypothetical protein
MTKVVEKKKLTKFREWVAMKLVTLAQWVYPQSEAVKAFYMQLVQDEMVYGQSIVRMNPEEIYSSPEKKPQSPEGKGK